MKNIVRSRPSWMSERINRRRGRVQLRGDRSWKGQPVIDTVRVKLTDDITGVNVNQAMAASWRFKGNDRKNRFVFGDQAGAITKRKNSIIDFGNDDVRDVLVFRNSVPGKPFNHAQRFVIKNMGTQDRIVLKNIGKTFDFKDVRNDGSLPGVPRTSFRVVSFADV